MLKIELGEHALVTESAVREPQVYRLRSGDLLLTYHVQSDSHFAERQGLRSRDGGRTWEPEAQRAHREQAIGENGHGLVLANDMYTFERTPGEFVGSHFRSDDGGATFTGPHPLRVLVNRVMVQPYPTPAHFPDDDHPLRAFYQPLPAYYQPTVKGASMARGPHFWRYLVWHRDAWLTTMYCYFHGDRVRRVILVASQDQGRTWHYRSTVAYDHEEPREGFNEPVLAQVADGSLLCVMRRGGNYPLAQARSRDGGETWSTPEAIRGHGVNPDLCLMSNGVLACTFGRPGRHIMFSEDGCGGSWGDQTAIGDWRGSTYMGLAEVGPGELLVVYDQRDDDAPQHAASGRRVRSLRVRVERIPLA